MDNDFYECREEDEVRKPKESKKSGGGAKLVVGFVIGVAVTFVAALFVMLGMRNTYEQIITQSQSSASLSEEGETSLSEISEKMELLQSYIDQYFLFDEDYSSVAEGVYKAMLSSLDDPYSCYYTEEEYTSLMQSTNGTYVGIGATVSKDEDTGYILVVSTFEGSGAEESGVLAGDLIMEIGDESTVDLDVSSAAALMKGEEGTTVDITVYRPDTEETLEFTITRKQIEITTAAGEMLDNGIGYVVISEFEGVTAQQFEEILEDLTAQGMKGLIVDLRDNPGGLLTSVNDILDLLLPDDSLLVYTEDKYGNRSEYYAEDAGYYDIPMAVLVNGNSASASEIFAGAMKDYERATLVGTQTFGKGIVQTIRQLSDGSAIKLTVARYYTPDGICIHGEGITPDVVLEYDSTSEGTDWDDDNQLKAAYDELLKKIN